MFNIDESLHNSDWSKKTPDSISDLESAKKPLSPEAEMKGFVKPYTKADGTRVEGYYTGRSKKAEEAPSPSTPKAEAESGSRSSVSLGKIGDPMPKSVEVTGSNTAKFAETKEAVVKDLNIPSDISSVIKAAGVTETAETKVSIIGPGNNWTDNGSSVVLIVSNDGFKNIRAFSKNDDGELILKNESFKVYDKGKGLGAKMLARQIKHCQDLGVVQISCDAIRVDGYTKKVPAERINGGQASGYFVWPLMGYDGEIDWYKHKDAFWDEEYDTGDYDNWDELMQDAPESVRNAERVQEIMATEEGRLWWHKYGIGMDLDFDLREGSESMRIFSEYLNRKGYV